MRRDFQIIDNLGFVIEDVTVDVEVGVTLEQAAAEARAVFESDMRSAYDEGDQYKADGVMGSVAEVRWVMPSSYARASDPAL